MTASLKDTKKELAGTKMALGMIEKTLKKTTEELKLKQDLVENTLRDHA